MCSSDLLFSFYLDTNCILVSKSGLLIKSSRLDISELRNYFATIKLVTSCSKWTGPYNNERTRYKKIRLKKTRNKKYITSYRLNSHKFLNDMP